MKTSHRAPFAAWAGWISPGAEVVHWFAGVGTVIWMNKDSAGVQWRRGGRGIAYVRELAKSNDELCGGGPTGGSNAD